MQTYANQPSGTVGRARALRRDSTDAEKRPWRALRQGTTAKWRRQVPVGPYFADFLCFSARLIVEADGGQHAEQEAHDARRTAYLKREGYRVLRFWNNDLLSNTDGVIDVILANLSPSPSQPLAGPLPLPVGEGIVFGA